MFTLVSCLGTALRPEQFCFPTGFWVTRFKGPRRRGGAITILPSQLKIVMPRFWIGLFLGLPRFRMTSFMPHASLGASSALSTTLETERNLKKTILADLDSSFPCLNHFSNQKSMHVPAQHIQKIQTDWFYTHRKHICIGMSLSCTYLLNHWFTYHYIDSNYIHDCMYVKVETARIVTHVCV